MSVGPSNDAMDVDNASGNDAGPSTSAPPPVMARSTSQLSGTSPAPPQRPRVGFVYSSEMMAHAPGPEDHHPEQPARIERIHSMLRGEGVLSQMKALPARTVKKEEAMLVHSEDHWDKVLQLQRELTLLISTPVIAIRCINTLILASLFALLIQT
jgi:histone deacetylase 6